jgi:hypothetical protein
MTSTQRSGANDQTPSVEDAIGDHELKPETLMLSYGYGKDQFDAAAFAGFLRNYPKVSKGSFPAVPGG